MSRAVGVLGGGPWGVALACAARRAGHDVLLCTRKSDRALAALELPTTGDVRALAKAATLIFVAVPSDVVREVARGLGDAIDGSHYVVHGIRGLSVEGLTPISDVLRDETPCRRVGAIGGPGVARDLTEGNLGVLAAASRFPEVTAAVRTALESSALRVSCTHDLTGLEWASALNGCLLVAVGYGRAIGASPAVLAGLLTRGIHEASRVGVAAGAEASTFFSIAGIGDVLAAMGGDERPEVRLGVALGEGATPDQAKSRAGQRVEAPAVALQVLAFAKERRLDVPVFRTIAAAMAGTITREEVLKGLMARDKH